MVVDGRVNGDVIGAQMIEDSIRTHATFTRKDIRERLDVLGLRVTASLESSIKAPRRPIFVVGCPRSGTSLVFALLRRHPLLKSLPNEGHVLWNAFQHPRLKGWSSDRASAEDVQRGEPNYLYTSIRRITGGDRFLDKTPKNALKIPYLASLFPDATFVFIRRDGRDTVSSLIEGWTARRGLSYRLPRALCLAEYRGHLWSYILPARWRRLIGTSIADVAAFQYVSTNETVLEDKEHLHDGAFVDVAFEDVVARPVEEMRRLLDRLDLGHSNEVLEMASSLGAHHVGSISAPRPGKWRERAEAITHVFPQLAPTMNRLGYETEGEP